MTTPFLQRVDELAPKLNITRVSDGPEGDQLQAAAKHTDLFLDQGMAAAQAKEPERDYRKQNFRDLGPRADAMVIAAITAPWMVHCPHVSPTTAAPILGDLPSWVVYCQRCSPPPGGPRTLPDQCDFCLTRGQEEFIPLAIRTGHIIATGDACLECGEAVLAEFSSGD